MSKYLDRKFLSSIAVFGVGLYVAATGSSVSGVEIADAVGTWLALSAPLVFVVVEGVVDRMGVGLSVQQQVVKFQVEKMEMARELVKVQAEAGIEAIALTSDQLVNVITHKDGGYV